MPAKKENKGCGCTTIPISLIIVLLGISYGCFKYLNNSSINFGQLIMTQIAQFLPEQITKRLPAQQQTSPKITPTPSQSVPSPISNSPLVQVSPTTTPTITLKVPPSPVTSTTPTLSQTPWEKKVIRGIYLSRYQITNNTDEKTIRERVRYYHSQGINTIIHGVWGNGCTMYNSEVMQQTFGYKSCPNKFRNEWLNWLIDEAHQQGMEVHAYFEKGIKIDKNSPIFDLAVSQKWLVPGVDRTYSGIEHYVLDVENVEVANLLKDILVEFVQIYPTVEAVQWDDYLGYHAELPGKVDRTQKLTKFVQQMIVAMKKANPKVSFDLCHHNPYWAKRYFAADWEKWGVDRVFIQNYNDANFNQELNYAEKYAGVAITDRQLYRIKELVNNSKIKSVLVFPLAGKPEETAASIKKAALYTSCSSQTKSDCQNKLIVKEK